MRRTTHPPDVPRVLVRVRCSRVLVLLQAGDAAADPSEPKLSSWGGRRAPERNDGAGDPDRRSGAGGGPGRR